MLEKEDLSLEEKIKLLGGKSGDEVAEKYGIRYFTMSDGPHGVKKHGVCYPNMCLVSGCWDPDLLYAMGESIGYDCNAEGIDVLLGPSVNVKRNPLCGRNFEYVSEDPYLAGTLGAAFINGLQSTGASACVKHYCCYNQETNRFTQRVFVDEDVMMNVYVRVFRILLNKSAPDFLMTAYNAVNGKFVSENKNLLKYVLRKLLGYKGTVISDWGGMDYRSKSLKVGVDVNMPGDVDTSWKEVVKTIENGDLTEKELDESFGRVCAALRRALKEKPLKETDKSLLGKIASESIVLLKNEGEILPLSGKESVAVIGALAKNSCVQGGGCAAVENGGATDIYTELCSRTGRELPYAAGYSADGAERDEALEREALERSKGTDGVLFFAGLPSFAESEGYDRKNLSLPENQLELLKQLAGAGKKIIVVLTNGSAVELGEVRSFASAILECWYAGDVYAQACCDVLFGNVNPSGRLAETLPLHLSDYFPEENYVDAKDCVRYREGENVGYKYYAAAGRRVCYPFGYGLSYTKFEYESCRLAPATQKGAELSAEVTLRNAGGRAGKEVVQVYLRHESEKVYSLAGFSKVELQAGESKKVIIELDSECFTKYNSMQKTYAIRPGKYFISVRRDAETPVWEDSADIGKKFRCTRYTKIGELIKVGNGPALIAKYLAKYICKAALDDSSYPLRIDGREIAENVFLRNVAYSFPLYIFTTLTAGMLGNVELDGIIGKINDELVFDA